MRSNEVDIDLSLYEHVENARLYEGKDLNIIGTDGDNLIIGNDGANTMTGLGGNDVYTINRLDDVVIEAVGGGNDEILSGRVSIDLTNYANVENARLVNTTAASNLDIIGTDVDNVLIGHNKQNNIFGFGGDDTINSGFGKDTIYGGDGDDFLIGHGNNDRLFGGDGLDRLVGGSGKDTLTGGVDADMFEFASVLHSGTTPLSRDVIADFQQGSDKIDLSGIDAHTMAGDQAFTFIWAAPFSSVKGQVRVIADASSTYVLGDVDGDGIKDFVIELTGVYALGAGDFVL